MFEWWRRICHQVRQGTGERQCYSPREASPSQPLPGSGDEAWQVCTRLQDCFPHPSVMLPGHQPSMPALTGCSHEWGTLSTAQKLTPLPSWITLSMVSCCLFSSARCSSPFLLLPLPLAPGDLLQHHQPWVAPLSFSGCGEGYVQHIQCPPQHTHWDGRITPHNVAAQYKCAHPFAGLSQRPWREVRSLSQLIISNCLNKLGT